MNPVEPKPFIHEGMNRAQRRKAAHKTKPYAAIEAKRHRAKLRRNAKKASSKRNGNQG